MIVFPVLTAIISAMCAGVLAHDAKRRPRPDKIVWAIAFVAFTVAAATDAAGRGIAWSTWLAKTYYSTGPALVVMYLAIGELYLLFPRQMARFGVGATGLLTAFWIAMVVNAPIDRARLATDGWEAIERGTLMTTVTVLINAIGTTIIVGGTGYSVWSFWRRGIMRNRMIGCALIAAGTLVVGAGGTLTRLGHYEYLYIAMSIGVAMIFAGVLETRRPEVVVAPATAGTVPARPAPVPKEPTQAAANPGVTSLEGRPMAVGRTPVDYIETVLLPLKDHDLARLCAEWSVPRDDAAVLTRADARHVWQLRARLSDDGIRAFDAHTVMARRQLATLYVEVIAADPSAPLRAPAHAGPDLPAQPQPAARAHAFVPADPSDEDELASAYA